jgi:hypothetical protein
LREQREENLLGHCVLLSVSNCVVPSLYSYDRSNWCLPYCQERIVVAVELSHILIRNCDRFDCHTRRTIDGIITLLTDLIEGITRLRNVTHCVLVTVWSVSVIRQRYLQGED